MATDTEAAREKKHVPYSGHTKDSDPQIVGQHGVFLLKVFEYHFGEWSFDKVYNLRSL